MANKPKLNKATLEAILSHKMKDLSMKDVIK
jgi:hypothetical protein